MILGHTTQLREIMLLGSPHIGWHQTCNMKYRSIVHCESMCMCNTNGHQPGILHTLLACNVLVVDLGRGLLQSVPSTY